MLNGISSIALTGFKYVYLLAFFTLLSGFFYPLITETSFYPVVGGVFVLFVGLAGGILLYKAATSRTKKRIFLAGGFALMLISLYFIFYVVQNL